MSTVDEGWGFLPGLSRKWHYFTKDGRSLCGGFGNLRAALEVGNDDSSDNCATCKRKLKGRKNGRNNDS